MNFRNILNVCKLHTICKLPILSPNIKCFNQLFLRSCSNTNKPHIVQMRGLDIETKEGDVIEYFKPLGITPKVIYLKCDAAGRTSAISEVEFYTHAEAVVAMRKKNAFMGNRFIRLTLKSSEVTIDTKKPVVNKDTYLNQAIRDNLSISKCLERSPIPFGHIIKMKNVPRRTTDQAIYEFFWHVGLTPVSSKPKYDESGIRTGEFEVQFLTKEDAFKAMIKNNACLGQKK